MRKLLRAAVTGALFLILLALALPFLLPADTYKPALEAQLAAATGRHVMIDSLRLTMLPAPEIQARGITVLGSGSGFDALRIRSMDVIPDLAELLFNKQFVIRRIRLDGIKTRVTLLQTLLDQIRAQRSAGGAGALVAVEQISAQQVSFELAQGAVLGPFDFALTLNPALVPIHARVERSDRRAQLRLERAGEAYRVGFHARDWTLPIGPALSFQSLDAEGRLLDGTLAFTRIEAATYGGGASAAGQLSWRDGWRFDGQARARTVAMAPIVRLFGGGGFSGSFSGDLLIHLQGDTLARLFLQPLISGEFTIADGTITRAGRDRPWFAFQALSARGSVSRLGLVTKDTRLRAYGGEVTGETATTWLNGWAVEADLKAAELDTADLLAGFVERPVLSGRFSGAAHTVLVAPRFRDLAANPTVTGQFHLVDGVIYKADLQQATSKLTRQDATGGQTAFKTFDGELTMKGGDVALDDLHMMSTALKADGRLQIGRDGQLAGRVDVGVRNTASLLSIPIVVSGTTEEPHLRPTSSAMIGGVLGTSLLGPGVGTAVGIKVGKFVEAIGAAIGGKGAEKKVGREE